MREFPANTLDTAWPRITRTTWLYMVMTSYFRAQNKTKYRFIT